MDPVWIWAIVVALAIFVEFITLDLFCIWIALGGIVGLILCACGVGVEIQLTCSIVLALGCILGLRPFAVKFLFTNSDSNDAEPLISKQTKLLQDCDTDTLGKVKLNGVEWVVFSNEKILTGEKVEVVSIKGNKLEVKRVNNDNKSQNDDTSTQEEVSTQEIAQEKNNN